MYTLESLQQKNLKELKEIGWQLNVLPDGDRRCRQNWIDAIAGVNPPLLQLLEVSPGVETVQEAIEVQAQEPIEIQAQEPIAQAAKISPGVIEELLDIEKLFLSETCDCPACGGSDTLFPDWEDEYAFGFWTIRCTHCYSTCCTDTLPPCFLDDDDDDDDDKPIAQTVKNSPGVNFDPEEFRQTHAPEIESYFESFTEADRPPNRGDNGRDRLESEPEMSQSAIVQAAKNSPGVKSKSTAHQLLELFKSKAHIIPDSPVEEEVTESAIGQTEVDQLSDQNPILTGCTLSAEFLARYSPPQPEIIHFQSDADGQLSLLDFEVESTDEPPDPDDFDTLDTFREAMARWDAENAEALTISMDSMCEWAPCPDDWYEPESPNSPLKASSMGESSSTCEFLIPVFDAWCDRANRPTDSDEPPDTGIFARLPKPKPPSFPPVSVGKGDRANNIRKFARSASCSSGRSPPSGGDFM
ncbi:hypothetical protein QUA26_28705 [Microcoleus sp. Pol12A4]|uniref:hypothetical protein n=1 Tax=unclassified Microcoleus TaxID=2642155 RepID=UPI002FD748B5